jgi:hypothetical protein
VQVAGASKEIVFRVREGATASVVKRKTRNKGKTHRKPVVPRVQLLLKRALSCRVRTPLEMDGEAGGHPLNAACSWTALSTTVLQSSSSISSSQSHRSCSTRSDRTQRRSCLTAVKQDCHKVTHTSLVTIRPPNSSCQLRRDSHSTTPLNPFRRAGFAHVTRGWMNSSTMHVESCNCRVR